MGPHFAKASFNTWVMLEMSWRKDERMEAKFPGGGGGHLRTEHRSTGTQFTYMALTF